eukprot:10994739-Ditylum_brightwellii.AAC.1
MPPQCLPPTNQSDDNVGVSVPRLPPMTPLEGHTLLDFAAAASAQQEMSVSTLVALPANFLPVTSVSISHNKKNEAKYMTDVSHSYNPMSTEYRNIIESEAAMLASATAAIQGKKRPAETRHGLPHVVDKSTEDGTTTSFTMNSSTDAQGGSEMRESMGDLSSQ